MVNNELAKRLVLLRLQGAIESEEKLLVHQRIEVRQTQASMVSKKFHPRSDAALDPVSSSPCSESDPRSEWEKRSGRITSIDVLEVVKACKMCIWL